jgi:hypothetical protein
MYYSLEHPIYPDAGLDPDNILYRGFHETSAYNFSMDDLALKRQIAQANGVPQVGKGAIATPFIKGSIIDLSTVVNWDMPLQKFSRDANALSNATTSTSSTTTSTISSATSPYNSATDTSTSSSSESKTPYPIYPCTKSINNNDNITLIPSVTTNTTSGTTSMNKNNNRISSSSIYPLQNYSQYGNALSNATTSTSSSKGSSSPTSSPISPYSSIHFQPATYQSTSLSSMQKRSQNNSYDELQHEQHHSTTTTIDDTKEYFPFSDTMYNNKIRKIL